MKHEIKRDYYLEQLIKRKNNGLIMSVSLTAWQIKGIAMYM